MLGFPLTTVGTMMRGAAAVCPGVSGAGPGGGCREAGGGVSIVKETAENLCSDWLSLSYMTRIFKKTTGSFFQDAARSAPG